MSLMSSMCSAYEGLLISGWLSALVILGDCEEVIVLTSKIRTLPSTTAVLPHQPLPCPFAAAKSLVRGVSKKFSETESRPTCPMPSLISTVLLPSAVYTAEKPLNSLLASSLANTLPKMVCGLGCLGLAQDPYLVRCVKDVFTHYIYRFPVKTSKNYTTTTHPFIICLHDAEVREEVLHELRPIFLEVVRDSYLGKRGVSTLHLHIVISLILELLNRNTYEWLEGISSLLLLPLLELMLTLEDHATKRVATDLLQKVLQEAENQDTPLRGKLVKCVRQLVVQHVSWSSARLFRVLSVLGVLHRELLVDCLPHIAQAVTATEEKRGTGLDHTLRHGYQTLLASLGVNEGDIKPS
ncbi:hypothetical protein OTU49_007292 [Cherax quadricarinatus]|uniref:MMS22-like C-terminal domain-containing protein n=2 Tax=Cherax quadricarinatus TaxID=27406 RepID=A0AAW0WHX6_CHEQU